MSVEDTITPDRDIVTAEKSTSVKLSCTCSSSLTNGLLWYRQYPGSAPHFIIQDYAGSITNPVPGLTIRNVKDQKLVELEISSAEVTDSALYYCALKPTVTGSPETLYKNLALPQRAFKCNITKTS